MSEGKKKATKRVAKKSATKTRTVKKSPEPPKGGGLNFYWIYGIVGFALLSMIFMNSEVVERKSSFLNSRN